MRGVCAPFFALYLTLGILLADDPLGFTLSLNVVWDLASFVPYAAVVMPSVGAAIRGTLGADYGQVGGALGSGALSLRLLSTRVHCNLKV